MKTVNRSVHWADARIIIRHRGWWLWSWTIYGYIPHHPELVGREGFAFTYDGAMKVVGRIMMSISNEVNERKK